MVSAGTTAAPEVDSASGSETGGDASPSSTVSFVVVSHAADDHTATDGGGSTEGAPPAAATMDEGATEEGAVDVA